jgi:NarL family two-component system response regulator LiaR
MQMKVIKIILADDHPAMREGTCHILEQAPDFRVVGVAEDGESALSMVKQLQPDVALVDIRMPRLDGIEAVRIMRESAPETKTLVLTAYDDDECVLAVMEAGASGYLLKTVKADELIDAVRRVDLGDIVLHPTIAAKLARLWNRRRHWATLKSPEMLSSRELQVLEMMAKGLRNKAIADKLNISIRTVEGHCNNIFSKLHVNSRVEAVLYALSRHHDSRGTKPASD